MAWYRWLPGSSWGSWHLGPDARLFAYGDTTLCGLVIPHQQGEVTVSIALAEPPENEKTCETCLRLAHRGGQAEAAYADAAEAIPAKPAPRKRPSRAKASTTKPAAPKRKRPSRATAKTKP